MQVGVVNLFIVITNYESQNKNLIFRLLHIFMDILSCLSGWIFNFIHRRWHKEKLSQRKNLIRKFEQQK